METTIWIAKAEGRTSIIRNFIDGEHCSKSLFLDSFIKVIFRVRF